MIKRAILGCLCVIGFIFFVVYLFRAGEMGISSPTRDYLAHKQAREAATLTRYKLDLVDPNEAPNGIRHYARQGYLVLIDTQTYAKQYIGDGLNCTNCHFSGGDTTGGVQGSISLVGVAAKYPSYEDRAKRVLDLPARINNCFMRSMNGTALPLDSELMLSVVTYLHWISKDVPIYAPIPWLGLKPLSVQSKGDAEQGKRVYHTYCALCHRDDGQGGENNPPLWGEHSFNDAAGFNRPETLAAFIYWNMPYDDATPVLTEKQALDVAAYILSHSRPKDTN